MVSFTYTSNAWPIKILHNKNKSEPASAVNWKHTFFGDCLLYLNDWKAGSWLAFMANFSFFLNYKYISCKLQSWLAKSWHIPELEKTPTRHRLKALLNHQIDRENRTWHQTDSNKTRQQACGGDFFMRSLGRLFHKQLCWGHWFKWQKPVFYCLDTHHRRLCQTHTYTYFICEVGKHLSWLKAGKKKAYTHTI